MLKTCSRANVPYMLMCLVCLCPHMSTCLACQCALHAYVLMCLACLCAHVPTFLRANVPCILRANMLYMLKCQRTLLAYVPYLLTCQCPLRAYVLVCQRATLNNINLFIIQICLLYLRVKRGNIGETLVNYWDLSPSN